MATPTEVKRLSDQYGVKSDAVRAVIGLSQPVRAQVKLQLTSYKQQLQGLVLSLGYKASLNLRKRQELLVQQQKIVDQVSRVKSVLNMLNISNDFQDTEAIQPLVKLLVASSGTIGTKISSFSDLESQIAKTTYKARQVTRAASIAEISARKINDKINIAAKYIGLIDAIERI